MSKIKKLQKRKRQKKIKVIKEEVSSGFLNILPNLIGTIITIIIGVSLIPIIAQQVDNSLNCINQTSVNVTELPKGSTDSFGGAGAETHFGGYDGKVVHKSFLSQYSIINTNESFFGCQNRITGAGASMLSVVPIFFALGILGVAIASIYAALRSSGMM